MHIHIVGCPSQLWALPILAATATRCAHFPGNSAGMHACMNARRQIIHPSGNGPYINKLLRKLPPRHRKAAATATAPRLDSRTGTD
jgi:hypothetical protein